MTFHGRLDAKENHFKSIWIELFSWDNKLLMQTNKNGFIDFFAILPVSSFRRFVLVIRKIQLGAPSNLNFFHGLTKLAIPI